MGSLPEKCWEETWKPWLHERAPPAAGAVAGAVLKEVGRGGAGREAGLLGLRPPKSLKGLNPNWPLMVAKVKARTMKTFI